MRNSIILTLVTCYISSCALYPSGCYQECPEGYNGFVKFYLDDKLNPEDSLDASFYGYSYCREGAITFLTDGYPSRNTVTAGLPKPNKEPVELEGKVIVDYGRGYQKRVYKEGFLVLLETYDTDSLIVDRYVLNKGSVDSEVYDYCIALYRNLKPFNKNCVRIKEGRKNIYYVLGK